jgi:P2 family phage major capsid protein
MRPETRKQIEAYCARIAELNGVSSVANKFAATPSVQQTLETKMQESSEFLSKINIIGVNELQGEKVGLGVGGTIASNTDTSSADRQTQDPTTLDADGYLCRQNNFDTHITYAKLDTWSKFPDFQTRLRDAILKRQALDRIMIGFNGTSYAATSDRAANPLLQDVNIGWLQKYRDNATARVLDEVVDASGKVSVYAGGDYENLDSLVFDAVNNLIEPWYQDDTGLVAIMGRDLLADKYFPMINQAQPATEQMATDVVTSQKRVGGLPAARVPHFPAGAILITSFENLSVYWQEGGRRRYIQENPKRDRIENFESSNDAYVVEDYGFGCLIENIVTEAPAAP